MSKNLFQKSLDYIKEKYSRFEEEELKICGQNLLFFQNYSYPFYQVEEDETNYNDLKFNLFLNSLLYFSRKLSFSLLDNFTKFILEYDNQNVNNNISLKLIIDKIFQKMELEYENLRKKKKNFKETDYEKVLLSCYGIWVDFWQNNFKHTTTEIEYLPIFVDYLNDMNEETKKYLDEYIEDYLRRKKEKKSSPEQNFEKENWEIKDFFERKGKKKSGFIFYTVKNTEKEAEKTGLKEISSILREEYDNNVKHNVDASLKHKIIFKIIKHLSLKIVNENGDEDEGEEIENKPFVEVSKIKEFLIGISEGTKTLRNDGEIDTEEKYFAGESLEDIETILLDLHKLGVIIYFNDPSLKEVVVSDPKWFNKVKLKIFIY